MFVDLAQFIIRAYQLLFSPIFAGSCRFTPSCSQYAAEAIGRFGVLRGTYLAGRRLCRCHPFGAHGVDPVPDFAPSAFALRPAALRRAQGRPEQGRRTADRAAARRGRPL